MKKASETRFVLIKRAPAFLTALFFICGAAIASKTYVFPTVGNFFGPHLPTNAIIVILLIAAVCAGLLFGFRKNALPAVLLCVMLIGFLMAQMRIEGSYEDSNFIEHTQIEGRVASAQANGANSMSLILKDAVLIGESRQEIGGRISLIVYGQSAAYLQSEYDIAGSVIKAQATLMYPSGAADYGFTNERLSLLADGVAYKSLAHYSAVEVVQYKPPGELRTFFSEMRQNLFGRMEQYIGGQDAAFYTALITGDKSALDMSVKTSFADLGISHLLATSGLHIGILLMIFGIIFKKLRTPIVIRSVISFAVILIFLCFAGFRVSMMRASFMWLLLTMSKLWGERVSPLNTLGIAMLVLLALNPLCIFDISFVLSCASVAGIVLFSKMLTNVQKIKHGGKTLSLMLTTVAVVFFTWPVVAYYFNSISLLSPIYNIIFVPISSVALFVGMVFGMLSGIGFLAPVLGTLAKALSYIIIQGAHWLSGSAPSLNMVSPPFAVIILWMAGAASLSVLVFETKKKRMRIASLSVMAAAVIIMAVTQVRIENEQTVKAYTDGSGMLIYVKDGKQNALILDGESYIAYNVLRKNAADGVDMLIYSGDSDEDLGELIDSLDGVKVGAVYAARDVADVYNLRSEVSVMPLNNVSILGYDIELLPFKAKSKTAKTHYAAHIYNENQSIIYIDALYLREGAFEGRHFSDAVCSAWTKSRAENISVLDFGSLYFCDTGVFAREGALALESAGANIYNITQGTAVLYRGEGN